MHIYKPLKQSEETSCEDTVSYCGGLSRASKLSKLVCFLTTEALEEQNKAGAIQERRVTNRTEPWRHGDQTPGWGC